MIFIQQNKDVNDQVFIKCLVWTSDSASQRQSIKIYSESSDTLDRS